MKHILHLIETSGPGGAEKMLLSMVDNLASDKFRSSVCLIKSGWLRDELTKRNINTRIIPLDRPFDLNWIYAIKKLVQENDVDLIHSHEFAMNFFGTVSAVLSGTPIVTTVHGKNYYWEKLRRRLAYRFTSRYSHMVAVSEDMRDFLCSRVGISKNKISVVHNGIDVTKFEENNDLRKTTRDELGIPTDSVVVGAIGNLYSVKGHTYLLKAIALLASDYPDLVLLIAGRGELMQSLKQEATELGIIDNVQLLGFRNDVHAIMQAIDIFALPSLSEGLPLSALEAMATSKPVVASDVGGVGEVVGDGVTGFLTQPKNPKSIAEKMLILLKDKALAKEFGVAGKHTVDEKFSLPIMVGKYHDIFKAKGIL